MKNRLLILILMNFSEQVMASQAPQKRTSTDWHQRNRYENLELLRIRVSNRLTSSSPSMIQNSKKDLEQNLWFERQNLARNRLVQEEIATRKFLIHAAVVELHAFNSRLPYDPALHADQNQDVKVVDPKALALYRELEPDIIAPLIQRAPRVHVGIAKRKLQSFQEPF